MEIKANSFSLRGESDLVKIVSDSVFAPANESSMYTDEAECDLIVEISIVFKDVHGECLVLCSMDDKKALAGEPWGFYATP
jgi:hypothetical protein